MNDTCLFYQFYVCNDGLKIIMCLFFCFWYEVESLVLLDLIYLLPDMQESAVATMELQNQMQLMQSS